VDAGQKRLVTQYRESPNLIHLLRTYLRQVEVVYQELAGMLDFFELGPIGVDQQAEAPEGRQPAVGHQLTLIGKRLGFGRTHCICQSRPVFGFDCEGTPSRYNIVGFCNIASTWIDCGAQVNVDITIENDDIYRRFLQVRCYQMLQRFARSDLQACCTILWGDAATVLDYGNSRVVLAPGRPLTQEEENLKQLYPRVLPVALGVDVRFHFGSLPVWGFGEGWEGVCNEVSSPLILVDEAGNYIVDESGNRIELELMYKGGEWMCEEDVHPYDCAETSALSA
jgi:hypothetical protein